LEVEEHGGITGRGVLLDYAEWATTNSITISALESEAITIGILELVHTVNANSIRALYRFRGMSVIELPGLLVVLRNPNCVYDDILTFNSQGSTQWDGFRHYGMLSSDIRTPVQISFAASTTRSGVSRFSVPSWSSFPNRITKDPGHILLSTPNHGKTR
jgi:hypothetical protein